MITARYARYMVIVFDVNGTLLDLTVVHRWFDERSSETGTGSRWFAELVRLSLLSSITNRYRPFPDLALDAYSTILGHADGARETVELLASLPVHADVPRILDRLEGDGHRLVALTNSPLGMARAQLAVGGIADRFETVLSVDMVQRFKPDPLVYRTAAARLAVPIPSMTMVAAHDWDVAGAVAAGSRGIYVNRSGERYPDSFPRPDAVIERMDDLPDVLA
ncbi:MAG: haloacid dehalogenase type II [Acidimicrobiia bacterium]|nr:haloacid dehalogenase type II [Acidimicrobiia bacterium]